MFNSNRNNPSSYRHYLSPLERLDQRTAKWKPNKVRENDDYKELCRKGECSPFQPPPSSYRYYHINRETSTDTLDDLTEYAQVTTEFSIDTEGQSRRPPQQPDPALIQIEFIQQDYPSLILLIETLHLPPQHSKRFEKIRELCQAISRTIIRSIRGDRRKQSYGSSSVSTCSTNTTCPESTRGTFKASSSGYSTVHIRLRHMSRSSKPKRTLYRWPYSLHATSG